MEATVFSILNSDSTIKALVGDRIFPVVVDDLSEVPYLKFYKSGVNDIIRDLATGQPMFQDLELTIEAFHFYELPLQQLKEAIKNALEGYTGGDWRFFLEDENQDDERFSFQQIFQAIGIDT